MPYIFISYSHKDSDYAHKLAKALAQKNLSVWMDADINYGTPWPLEIEKKINGCSAFIVIMTSNSKQSDWVQNELVYAKNKGKPIFPLLLEGDVWFPVATIQNVEVRDGNLPSPDFFERLNAIVSGRGIGGFTQSDLGALKLGELREPSLYEGGLAKIGGRKPSLSKVRRLRGPSTKRPKQATNFFEGSFALVLDLLARQRESKIWKTEDKLVQAAIFHTFEPELIHIPAGKFLMGSDSNVDKNAYNNEQSQHTLYLPDYYMAKTPITNILYAVFLQSTNYQKPQGWTNSEPPIGRENHPVEGVSWHDAVAYCVWLSEVTGRGYRLPTEAEWEKAARGTDGDIYPWGNEWDERLCNTGEGGVGDTTPVGAYPDGASPYGLLDMAGNVWEWCATKGDKPYPYDVAEDEWTADYLQGDAARALRGGSFSDSRSYARCAFRSKVSTSDWNYGFGFRVAFSPI